MLFSAAVVLTNETGDDGLVEKRIRTALIVMMTPNWPQALRRATVQSHGRCVQEAAAEAPTDAAASKQIHGERFDRPDLIWTDLNSE